jgi:arylformamidase
MSRSLEISDTTARYAVIPSCAMQTLWDISPAINADAPVFPGDTSYQQVVHFDHGPNCPVNVHAIRMSPHTGAHADAPMHYRAGGAAVGTLALEPYLGPCRVIDCTASVGLVQPEHVAHALHKLPARVLLKTSAKASQSWSSFTAVAPATLHALAQACPGICLIGIDTPSLDPSTSQDLPSHNTVFELGLRVLENLVLDDAPEGDYELIALPLKLSHCDASPVRAVLRALP